MSNLVGADVEDLERAADELTGYGRQIGGMGKPLRTQLHSIPWRGNNADRFRQDWDRLHVPALNEAAQFLQDAGGKLRTHAAEQRHASRDTGRPSRRIEFAGSSVDRDALLRWPLFWGGAAGAASTAAELVLSMSHLVGRFGGAAKVIGKVGAGVGIAIGFVDAARMEGYDGEYHAVEAGMDIVQAVIPVLIGAALAGTTVAALPAVAIVAGVGIGLVGVDMFLGSSTGKQFMGRAGRAIASSWRAVSGTVRDTWRAAAPVRSAAKRLVPKLLDAGARVRVTRPSTPPIFPPPWKGFPPRVLQPPLAL